MRRLVANMKRMVVGDVLAARERVALFHGTSITASEAIEMKDEEITYNFMLKAGVKCINIQVASLKPMALSRRGFETTESLRNFGFDALHMCDPSWCNEACLAYGQKELVNVFVVSASDAVAVSGSEAMAMLRITPNDLLERCAGFPGEAHSVLQQLPHGGSLRGVSVRTLLDSGLRATALKSCGYGFKHVMEQTGADARELAKLGFTLYH